MSAAGCSNSGPERTDAWKQAEIVSRYQLVRNAHPTIADISARHALELSRQGRVLFVDDREPVERAVSMLPGAVGADEFLANPGLGEGKLVVVYCTIGQRSADRVALLSSVGLQTANLAGGILAWTHEHGPLVNPLGVPTKRLHVYARSWSLADGEYEPVW